MAVSYTIAKEPFYIDYIQDDNSNEPNQKTIQLLYKLSTEAQENIVYCVYSTEFYYQNMIEIYMNG